MNRMTSPTPHDPPTAAPDRPRHAPLDPIVLVTGKGGVGKTSIAAGIAEAAARRDGVSMLIEFGDGESGRRVLASRANKSSKVVHKIVDPRDAMERAVATLLGSTVLAKLFLNNFAVRPMLRAAPAMRELAMLEAVRTFAEELPGKRVVVDMPATGHGLTWMRLPVQMRDMFASGPIHDLAKGLVDRLVAPGRCSVVVVTIPERLVLSETVELCRALETEVKLPPARLIVNRFPAELSEASFAQARALVARGGEEGTAAAELLRVIEARRAARTETLEILHTASGLHVTPLLLPESLDDVRPDEIATWLMAAGAA